MSKKAANIFLSIFLFILLFLTLIFFCLNILTSETGLGNAITFLTESFKEERIFSASDLSHQIGQVESDPKYKQEKVVVASPRDFDSSSEKNYLDLGPNVYLFPGEYEVSQDLIWDGSQGSTEVCILDTFNLSQGAIAQKIVKSVELNNQNYKSISYSFFTQGGRSFEFRNYYLGRSTLKAGETRVITKKKDYALFIKKIPHTFSKIWQSYF